MTTVPPKICIVAGEASGDLLGAGLMRALKKQRTDLVFIGVGGEAMTKEGLQSLVPMSDLSVMGIVEVLPRVRLILGHIQTVVDAVKQQRADVLVTIDSPDFSFRVAQRVHREAEIPCVHYVSPHVWAWRKGRVKKMARYLAHVLALFPFEENFYKGSGLSCTFVGHPVMERLKAYVGKKKVREAGVPPRIALMPGSRKSEIQRLWPVFQQAAVEILKQEPSATFMVPLAPGLTPDMFTTLTPLPVHFITGEKRYEALQHCDAALVASGTANLELAVLDVPMVVAYKLAPLTYMLARPFVKIHSFSPVNLVAEERVVPEYIQHAATPENLAAAVLPLLDATEARKHQLSAMSDVRTRLQVGGLLPSEKAADVVMTYLK